MGPVYSLPFPLALIVFVSFISIFSRRSLSASPVKKKYVDSSLFLLFLNKGISVLHISNYLQKCVCKP
mgnify:CR=1 FL=1